MKPASSLVTLSSLLTRIMATSALVFAFVWGLVLALCLGLLFPAHFSLWLLALLWLLSLVLLLPLFLVTRHYLIRLVAQPVTHLIANTQLTCVPHAALRSPDTQIAEINLLSRSIHHMMSKILQRENALLDSEKRLSLALRGSGEGVWDWNIEKNLSYIDDNCCEIIGVAPEAIRHDNRLWTQCLHPDDVTSAKNYFRRAAAGSITAFEQEYRIRKAGRGEWCWIEIRGSVVERGLDDKPLRMAGTISDITRRKLVELQLKLYSTAFMCTKNAVVMLDKDFIVLAVNRAFGEITQHQEPMVVGREYSFQHATIPTENLHQAIKLQVHNRCQWLGEALGQRADGTQYPQELAIYGVFDEQINLTHYVAIFSDITERKQTEENLRLLANYDPLTGLANRYLFNATLTRSLQGARRKEEKLALLFIDLDHFKAVNDLHGHAAGDRLLVEVARCIQSHIRESDMAARLAGDEFVVILENIQTSQDAERVANKIVHAIATIGDMGDPCYSGISASLGISLFPEQGQDVETLMRYADRAMYQAKTLGRNRFLFYHPDTESILVSLDSAEDPQLGGLSS